METKNEKKSEPEAQWKAVINIKNEFGFSDAEMRGLLGDMSADKYNAGFNNHSETLSEKELIRLSYLLGIYKGLRTLFADHKQAVTWLERENSMHPFEGVAPKQYILSGGEDKLSKTRQFIGGWCNR